MNTLDDKTDGVYKVTTQHGTHYIIDLDNRKCNCDFILDLDGQITCSVCGCRDEGKNKPTGAYTPNPDCERCAKDSVACIEHYMAQGGFND